MKTLKKILNGIKLVLASLTLCWVLCALFMPSISNTQILIVTAGSLAINYLLWNKYYDKWFHLTNSKS